MDETPLICGTGHTPGIRRGCRGDRGGGDEHQQNAWDVHLSRYPEKYAVLKQVLQT